MPFIPRRGLKNGTKKPDSQLRSVIDETAIPGAVELLKQNTAFAFPSGTTWALLVLEVDSIGGLSKKDHNNEAKGRIIELIGSDQIHIIATDEMLEAELLGIIPDTETMTRIEEFGLLRKAPYSWAVTWIENDNLQIEQTDQATDFESVRQIAFGEKSLREDIGESLWARYSGEGAQADAAVSEADEQTEPDQDNGFGEDPIEDQDESEAFPDEDEEEPEYEDDEEPDFLDDEAPAGESEVIADENGEVTEPETTQVISDPSFAEATAEASGETEGGVSLPSETYIETFDDGDDEGLYVQDDEDDEYAQSEDEHVADGDFAEAMGAPGAFADMAQVQNAIARRFMSGDLDLDIGLESFNTTFGIGAPVVQIATPVDSTEWLADQVTQLSRQANASLAQLHAANEDRLRTRFVNLISQHAEVVEKMVSTEKKDSHYGQMKRMADETRSQEMSEKDTKMRKVRTEVYEQHEKLAKEAGEAARRAAESSYRERHKSRMEREQSDRAAAIEAQIETDYTANIENINKLRRRGAQLQMEKGQTAVFTVLADDQAAAQQVEQELLERWSAQISEFIDNYRKADLSRADALAEHDRRTDELGEAQREHAAILESMAADYEQQRRAMRAEFEASEAQARQHLERVRTDMMHELEMKESDKLAVEKQLHEVKERAASIEREVEERFKTQLEDVREDRDAAQRSAAQMTEMQKRSSAMLIVLIVSLSIAAFLVGGLFFSTIIN